MAKPDRPPLLRPEEEPSGLLAGAPAGFTVHVVAEVVSTNAELAARAAAGSARPGEVLVAEYQTAGRGRMDRTWSSPPSAGLLASVLLPDPPDPWVPLLAGVAVARALRAAAGVPAVLKWPNDVLVGDRKLAGLLAGAAPPAGVVVGVGLNVSTRAAELPPAATSLFIEGAATTDRRELLFAILRELATERHPADYRSLCATVGREVVVTRPDGRAVTGRAELVDDLGRLLVSGVALSAGDVRHVR